MDVRYINPFVESVQHFFSTRLETDLIVSKPFLTLHADAQRADISAVIEITGDAKGWVALRFPMRSALTTAEKLAGEDLSAHQERLMDAVGEMAKIVADGAKTKISDLACEISLPRVTLRALPIPNVIKGKPRLVLPCDSQLGRFCVEVQLIVQAHARAKATESPGKNTSPAPSGAVEELPAVTLTDRSRSRAEAAP